MYQLFLSQSLMFDSVLMIRSLVNYVREADKEDHETDGSHGYGLGLVILSIYKNYSC